MHVLGVVGPSDSGKTTLVEQLVDRLTERGRVGTIKHLTRAPDIDTAGRDTDRHRRAGATTTVGITDDEGWFATGGDRTLDDTLDDLALDVEYTIVEGFSSARLPQIVLGGQAHGGTALATGETAAEVDVSAVVDRLASTDPYETLGSLVAQVKRSPDAPRAGAIATFTGRVRRSDGPDDPPTEYLEFERYDEVAAERTRTIRETLQERDGVYDVRLHHRTGVVESGEDIVFVVILAGHRREAFDAVEAGIDRLKAEVPLFKKEVTVEDEFWAHEDSHQT
jgi:molybdopterin synthase catalytic subunit